MRKLKSPIYSKPVYASQTVFETIKNVMIQFTKCPAPLLDTLASTIKRCTVTACHRLVALHHTRIEPDMGLLEI